MAFITQAEFSRRANVTRQRINALVKAGVFGTSAKQIDGRVMIDFEPGCLALQENLDPGRPIKCFQQAEGADLPGLVDLPGWPEEVHLDGTLSPLASLNLVFLIEAFMLPDLDPVKAISMLLEKCQKRYPEAFKDW